ncbi:hypothetical protein B0H14DRAFT_2650401 [Mycena olivaceomarginata]|nr:hypothetical protein B0H14DRAFT_2650401 [Mycena olivaceomarginata]
MYDRDEGERRFDSEPTSKTWFSQRQGLVFWVGKLVLLRRISGWGEEVGSRYFEGPVTSIGSVLVVVGDAGGDDEDSAKEIQVKRMPPFGIASAVRHNGHANPRQIRHFVITLKFIATQRSATVPRNNGEWKAAPGATERIQIQAPCLGLRPQWGAMRCAEELASHAAPPCVALDAYTTISSPMSLLQHFPGPYTVQLKQHQENRSPKSWLCHAEEKTLALFLQKPAWNFGVSQTHQNDESRVLRVLMCVMGNPADSLLRRDGRGGYRRERANISQIIGSNKRFLNAIEVTRFLENKRSNKVTKKATTPIAANAAHSKVNQFLDCSNAYPLFAVCRVPPGRSSLAADVVRLTGTAVRLVDGQIDLQRASLPPKASTPDDCLRRDRGSDHNSL